jgi:hypothetical protein
VSNDEQKATVQCSAVQPTASNTCCIQTFFSSSSFESDFNRCRFMASNTGVPCKFRIPSAPGKYRSPEEYSDTWLDEKLDIYATASVFYGIMTGEKAWLDLSTGDTKIFVKKGVKPKIGDELRMPGSIDAALTNLTELAYTKNPEERISAAQLVAALEELQAKHPIR